MTTPLAPRTTTAFFFQSIASFVVSSVATLVGIARMTTDGWIRAFLCLGILYTITSAFTLAKVVRDRQDESQLIGRVDKARLDKLLAEHDPFKVESL
jgi:hypothetical protein